MSGILTGRNQLDNSGIIGGYPTGHVIQVQTATLTGQDLSQVTTWDTITDMTVSITRKLSNSKIFVSAVVNYGVNNIGLVCRFRVYSSLDGIILGQSSGGAGNAIGLLNRGHPGNATNAMRNGTIQGLNTPSDTTATITYSLQFSMEMTSASYYVYVNRSYTESTGTAGGRTYSTITAMEIAP